MLGIYLLIGFCYGAFRLKKAKMVERIFFGLFWPVCVITDLAG